jgi:hypothetical protein
MAKKFGFLCGEKAKKASTPVLPEMLALYFEDIASTRPTLSSALGHPNQKLNN